MDSVAVITQTVRGLVHSAWKITKGNTKWRFTVPVNSRANVYIPYLADSTITESGKKILASGHLMASVSGMKLKGVETDTDAGMKYLVWTVGSGAYEVQW